MNGEQDLEGKRVMNEFVLTDKDFEDFDVNAPFIKMKGKFILIIYPLDFKKLPKKYPVQNEATLMYLSKMYNEMIPCDCKETAKFFGKIAQDLLVRFFADYKPTGRIVKHSFVWKSDFTIDNIKNFNKYAKTLDARKFKVVYKSKEEMG